MILFYHNFFIEYFIACLVPVENIKDFHNSKIFFIGKFTYVYDRVIIIHTCHLLCLWWCTKRSIFSKYILTQMIRLVLYYHKIISIAEKWPRIIIYYTEGYNTPPPAPILIQKTSCELLSSFCCNKKSWDNHINVQSKTVIL